MPNITDTLIDSLPADEPSLLIVGRATTKRFMEGAILSRRGLDLLNLVRVVVVECPDDCKKLYGWRGPIIIDHGWMPSGPMKRYIDNMIRINQLIGEGKARNKDLQKL